MSRILAKRPSPAMAVALIALLVALAGTAIAAAPKLSGPQKKQVGKIASKIFNKRIGGASVAHANSASTANTANSAKSAGTANTANTAKSAGTATTATSAKTANRATRADTATDAEKLGGLAASKYQQVIQGACPKNGAYGAIGSEGAAACIIPVMPVLMNQTAGEPAFANDLAAGLRVVGVCHDGATTEVLFRNTGSSNATLNWLYSDGATVDANGANVNAGQERAFSYAGKRLEGQFIWSVGSQIVTVNLHAYDGTSFCEIRGTAESASA
jgi:hypothetical protein